MEASATTVARTAISRATALRSLQEARRSATSASSLDTSNRHALMSLINDARSTLDEIATVQQYGSLLNQAPSTT